MPGIQRDIAAGTIPANGTDAQVIESLRTAKSGSSGVFGQVQDDSSIIGRMSDALAHPFQVGFADSMSLVLLSGGIVMLVAFLILLLMPAVELRSTSASAAARAEDSAARAAAAAPAADPGEHRAEVATVVGEPETGTGGRHAADGAGRHAAPEPATDEPRQQGTPGPSEA